MFRNYKKIRLWENVKEEQWLDWKWQLANRITTLEELEQVIALTKEEAYGVKMSLEKLRMAITPYYATLMHPGSSDCPIRKQAVPTIHETKISSYEFGDPLYEGVDSPVPGLTHRYPDRVLMLVTDQCSMYCRHCTRRRFVGINDDELSMHNLKISIDYIRKTKEIRDVLLSGGDPLCLADNRLEYILEKLRAIEHIEVIRIGTRIPVVMPQRITRNLCDMLRQFHPLWINTHFNHPKELTSDAMNACSMIIDSGIPLGNQSVLLKRINDCPYIMKTLVQKLVKNRIRPYYIYQCDLSEGIEHFRTQLSTGIEIIEMLRGHTSGFSVPTFVVDAPGGGGKIPVAPQYVISQSSEKVILRNFEGVICTYSETEDKSHKCNNCGICNEHINKKSYGLEKLLRGEQFCFIPQNNRRLKRREKYYDYRMA